MKVFMRILGVLIAIASIVLGIWVDIIILLVGGIEQIVAGFNATPKDGSLIAWGVVHLFLMGVGSFIAVVGFIAGVLMAIYGSYVRPRLRRRSRRQPIGRVAT